MKLNLANLPKVGERFEVRVKSASFTVEVIDARIRYGNVDALVKPVAGSGTFWTVYKAVPKTEKSFEPSGIMGTADEDVIVDEALEETSLI